MMTMLTMIVQHSLAAWRPRPAHHIGIWSRKVLLLFLLLITDECIRAWVQRLRQRDDYRKRQRQSSNNLWVLVTGMVCPKFVCFMMSKFWKVYIRRFVSIIFCSCPEIIWTLALPKVRCGVTSTKDRFQAVADQRSPDDLPENFVKSGVSPLWANKQPKTTVIGLLT